VKSIVRQCLGLLAFLVFAGPYAYGQEFHATLTICNKGSEQINVVVAIRDSLWPLTNFWEVSGWTSIAPGQCEIAYQEGGYPAYIGFGFHDSQNHWTAGHIGQAPDFGWNGFTKVLIKSDKRLCVRSQGMSYKIRNDPTPALDCASFHSGGNDPGGYVPLASALYFVPETKHCKHYDLIPGEPICSGGEYYLNVKPTANDTNLYASKGSESGKDVPSTGPSLGDQLMNELGKAEAEKRSKQEQAQAACPSCRFARFVDGCNAFYRDPANARYRSSKSTAWCECLSEHYQNVMTPEEESRYANDYERLFRRGIAQPSSTDPAWPRLHPACVACQQ
jgi:hypothetical protein